MVTVEEVALALYGRYNRGTAGMTGKLLREAGIVTTVMAGGKTGRRKYLDIHSAATVESVIRRLKRRVKVTAEAAGQMQLFKQQGAETEIGAEVTLEKCLLVIERMAAKIDDLTNAVNSLRIQLGGAKTVKVSEVVRKAIAVYGD